MEYLSAVATVQRVCWSAPVVVCTECVVLASSVGMSHRINTTIDRHTYTYYQTNTIIQHHIPTLRLRRQRGKDFRGVDVGQGAQALGHHVAHPFLRRRRVREQVRGHLCLCLGGLVGWVGGRVAFTVVFRGDIWGGGG